MASTILPAILRKQPTWEALLFTKIYKRLANVLGRPVISNYSTPTEKVFEYLDFLHKPFMQDGWSYIKDIGDFLKKIKHLGKISESAILVTADIVGLYPYIFWVCSL